MAVIFCQCVSPINISAANINRIGITLIKTPQFERTKESEPTTVLWLKLNNETDYLASKRHSQLSVQQD